MKEIFEHYVEHSFGERRQAEFKIRQFELNYKRFFPSDLDATLVDIGIGRGEMLTCMAAWGFRNYTGVDISPSTIAFCRSLGLQCVMTSDTTKWLSDNAGTFDLITVLDVLEHIKKDAAISFVAAMRSAMKEGAVLIIQVPNAQAPDSQLHRYNDITHEVGYVEHSLHQVLLAAGFHDVSFHAFEDVISRGLRKWLRTSLRSLYWTYVRSVRRINGNLNPEILAPVFFAVARK